MGIVSSKDETGAVVAGSIRGQDILDYEGRDLRDKMDICLSKYMWYWTIGGVLVSLPLCVYLKSQKPVFAAALVCPIGDMMYATNKCFPEKEAFAAHYKMLQQKRAMAIQQVMESEGTRGTDGPSQQPPAELPQFPDEPPASAEAAGGGMEGQQEQLVFDEQQGAAPERKRKGWW